jgi:hypothetical protein
MAAVRFTPVKSDRIAAARFHVGIGPKEPVKVHVMDSNMQDQIPPIDQTLPTNQGGWVDVDLSAYGLTADAGTDFYIAVEWTGDNSPGLGCDKTSPIHNRSWHWDGTGWKAMTNLDYMIRAVIGAKDPTTLTCSVSPTSITVGSKVTVTGSTDPPRSGVTITLTYTQPDRTTRTRTITTTANGTYSETHPAYYAGPWTVEASWPGDWHNTAATSQPAHFAAKSSSRISCRADPMSWLVGAGTTIRGDITPVRPSALVWIENSRDGGETWANVASTTTDSAGRYEYAWTPTATGQHTLRSRWAGDQDHMPAASFTVSVRVRKGEATLSCTVSPPSLSVDSNLTLSGTLTPAQAVTIAVSYTKPDGTKLSTECSTGPDGFFSEVYAPDSPGQWWVSALWEGDSTHEGSQSPPTSFIVFIQEIPQSGLALIPTLVTLLALSRENDPR